MSLIQECLESFGAFSGLNVSTDSNVNIDMYPTDGAAALINMESVMALNEIYEMNNVIECEMVHAIYDAKRLGVPVEESLGDKMKSLGDKIANIWEKVKKFFIDLKNKVVGWVKKMRDKIKGFFAKLKAGFKNAPADMKITVYGEEIVVSRGDVETMVKDRDKAVHVQGRIKDEARRHKENATRLRDENHKLKTENEKQAATIRRLTIKTYDYSNLYKIDAAVEEVYSACRSGILTKSVDEAIDNYINDINSATANARGFAKSNAQSKAAMDVANAVMDETADLLNTAFKIDGVDFKDTDGETVRTAMWSYVRGGAHSEDDKVFLTSLPIFKGKTDITDVVKEEVSRLDKKIVAFSNIENIIGAAFDDAIKRINEWSNQVKSSVNSPNGKAPTAGMTELSSALNGFSSAYGKLQSYMNTVLNVWFNGLIDWSKVLNSFTM